MPRSPEEAEERHGNSECGCWLADVGRVETQFFEFRIVVDAARCAIEVQHGMVEGNAGLPPQRRIEFRVRIHLGDVVEESDGDLMADGLNIAARLEGIAKPGTICLSEDAHRQVKARLDLAVYAKVN